MDKAQHGGLSNRLNNHATHDARCARFFSRGFRSPGSTRSADEPIGKHSRQVFRDGAHSRLRE